MSIFSGADFRPGDARHPEAESAAPAKGRDVKRLALVIGLGVLSWVATYVGMLELIEANMGDLGLIHKAIIGFSVAMLMTMIVWLLDRMFAPGNAVVKAAYVAGYIFLSLISVGFGFGFYWKVLESRGEASRSAESAITQVQTSLHGAATRLEQLQSTLDQLTALSSEKSEQEKATGRTCPDSRPGDGPRRKMREEDAARFKFASDFVKARVGTVKGDMAALDGDLQKIVKDDRSVIDAKTGTRNDFLRGVGRKLELTVTGFNAFRSDPQLRQIRSDLADRAEKTTIPGSKGVAISCPDAQLQMALRGVVRAIDQLPELEKPKIAAVEGSEATIEAFRRLTTTLFGLMSFKLPPSADELRELQKKAVQSIELQGDQAKPRSAALEVSGGLAKRDYVPLSVAIFVDLCLLLVSIGRPMNRFVGMQQAIREAERGPVYPILQRFYDIHADDARVKIFDVFREVIFDVNGHYHVAVPLNIPRMAEQRDILKREAQHLANVCYALEGKGILVRPRSFLPGLLAQRALRQRGSKFIECYDDVRRARARRYPGWRISHEKPAFKVYRFQQGAWQEMILGAVMGAGYEAEKERRRLDLARDIEASKSPALHPSPASYVEVHAPILRPVRPAATEANGASHDPLADIRPGYRPEPGIAWPATPYVNGHHPAPDLGAAFDLANNNTAPLTRLNGAPAEISPTPDDDHPVNHPATPSASAAEAGHEQAADTASETASPLEEEIAVERISGWYGRKGGSS